VGRWSSASESSWLAKCTGIAKPSSYAISAELIDFARDSAHTKRCLEPGCQRVSATFAAECPFCGTEESESVVGVYAKRAMRVGSATVRKCQRIVRNL
jgi:RNA polymerase subunit RPABC4/transcription elongation factor Spt4